MGRAVVMSRMHMEAREGACTVRLSVDVTWNRSRHQTPNATRLIINLLLLCLPLGRCEPAIRDNGSVHIRTELRHHTIGPRRYRYLMCTYVDTVGAVAGTVLLYFPGTGTHHTVPPLGATVPTVPIAFPGESHTGSRLLVDTGEARGHG